MEKRLHFLNKEDAYEHSEASEHLSKLSQDNSINIPREKKMIV